MRKLRGAPALALSVALAVCLSACGGPEAQEAGFTAADAAAYVKGTLDEAYLGQYDQAFLDLVGITEERAEETHSLTLSRAASAFLTRFQVEYPTTELQERVAGLYGELYAKASYEVGGAEAAENGYTVEVTVRPLDTVRRMDEGWDGFLEEFNTRFDWEAVNALSQADYEAWYRDEYDAPYGEAVADYLARVLPETAALEAEQLTLRVELGEDGYYALNMDDYAAIDSRIVEFGGAEEQGARPTPTSAPEGTGEPGGTAEPEASPTPIPGTSVVPEAPTLPDGE